MSRLFNISLQDLFRGLILAVVNSVLTTLYTALQNGGSIDWKSVALVAITSVIGYLLKALATDEEGKIMGKV